MSNIELRNVAKKYGNLGVLHSINECIEGPQFVVILGPSGCGKSTLLRMIAGLETISGGDLIVDGERLNDVPPHKRDMAMVFQNYALYPHLTIYDNLAYGLRMRKTSKDVIEQRITDAARMLQIEHLLDRKPSQLSGGQRQRVAMGRAIVRSPKAFLFDEPLSNLDAKLRNEMRVEIRRVHDAVKGTSIFVTHDQTEAMTMADRVIVMNGGQIVQRGAPTDVYNNPVNKFVATFVGSPTMNILAGRVIDTENVELEGGTKIRTRPLRNATPGQTVEVGIRPEHLSLDIECANSLQMRTDVVEMLGAQSIVHGKIGQTDASACLPGQLKFPANSLTRFSFDADSVHVFDGSSGDSLTCC